VRYKRYSYDMTPPVALIIDIIDSRELPDRAMAQSAISNAYAAAADDLTVLEPLWPTVGDEFQALFAEIGDALRVTAIMRLLFEDPLDCRFGLGHGDSRVVEAGRTGPILDGSAWWHARTSLEEVERRETRSAPYLRSWFIGSEPSEAALVTSHLLLRDHLIDAMSPRARRITAGTLLGMPQTELAQVEHISQSAVSQSLRRSGGAALVGAHQELLVGLAR
jgi:hypothetical protein